MMIAVEADNCNCSVWAQVNNDVRFCAEHHKYYRGTTQLISVSEIIRKTWAFKSNFSHAKPAVLANALNRGIVVDRLITKYLSNDLPMLRRGTRLDAIRLFLQFRR